MNPPFTRDSLRHDQMGPQAERMMKEREFIALQGDGNLRASSNMFVVLGTRLLSDNGTLATVLPTSAIAGPAGSAIRQFWAADMHIDTVISSHDPQRIFFSENTSIGEVLIVCRRWNPDAEKPPTRFVNLAYNPRTPFEAIALAKTLEEGGSGDFTEQWVDAEHMASGDWYAVNFHAPWLGIAYREMAANLVRLDSLAEIRPAGQRIRDSYRKFDQPTNSGRRALWHNRPDVTMSMRAETDVYIEPIKGKEHLAERYWGQRGRLLLSNRIRLNTNRVGAVLVDEPAVGSRWVPCRPQDDETAAAICAWFNSSPGFLATLAERDNVIPSRPAFSLATQNALRVPDFPANPKARDALATAFEEMKNQQLLPLPEMARDPVRMRLDDIVADALGYDREHVARIRKALSEEPSITNQPLYAETRQGGLL